MTQEQFSDIYKDCNYYRNIFATLNVDKSGGLAPHQPILLLAVIDLITQGVIFDNKIFISDILIQIFERYWRVLVSKDSKYQPKLYHPFYYLKNHKQRFWHLKFKPEFESLNSQTISFKFTSNKRLKEVVEYAYLDDSLFDLIQRDAVCRNELVDTLIAVWFRESNKQLEDILQINDEFQASLQAELETLDATQNFDADPRIILKKSYVRNAFFRTAILHLYDYRCAFCRLKVIRKLTQNIIDGAHIKPFAKSRISIISNGIALCKNHHWAFDQHWFTINDEYKIIIASNLEEDSPNAKPMRDFQGETIYLPSSEQYFPSLEFLRWHQNKFYQKEA
jgi:putative restriction endonuclease